MDTPNTPSKDFISELYRLRGDTTENLNERYLNMGFRCPLATYFDKNDLEECLGKDGATNMFISLTVYTSDQIVPFYSIRDHHGRLDHDEARIHVANCTKEIQYSFPDFLKNIVMESMEFKVSVCRREQSDPHAKRLNKITGFEFTPLSQPTLTDQQKVVLGDLRERIKKEERGIFLGNWCDCIPEPNADEDGNETIYIYAKATDWCLEEDKATGTIKKVAKSFFFIVADRKENVDKLKELHSVGLLDAITVVKSIYIRDINDAVRREAIKSAKSAIMSRNMSHNLGSHVMFYIKQKLYSVEKMAESGVLDDLHRIYSKEFIPNDIVTLEPHAVATIPNAKSGDTYVITAMSTHEEQVSYTLRPSSQKEGEVNPLEGRRFASNDIATGKSSFEMPFLVGMGRFINYLQERQDYIATIATDYIPSNSTINFKDFIYDELKPELRHARHKDTHNVGTEPKNLLMDYIAYSEGYESSSHLMLKSGEFDGSNPSSSTSKAAKDFDKLRQFNIAVPGGVIGRQAFFSIMENLIRNAAKHSVKSDLLRFRFDIIEPNDLDSALRDFRFRPEGTSSEGAASQDLTHDQLLPLYEKNSNKYIYLCITNMTSNKEDALSRLLEGIADPYIEESGVMSDKYKGIKEIRISAAWMRGYWIDSAIPKDEPPALSVCQVPQNTDGENNPEAGYLKYLIALPRPKSVALLVDDEKDHAEFNKRFENDGCGVFQYPRKKENETDEELEKKRRMVLNEVACHSLVLMHISCKDINVNHDIRRFVNARNAEIDQADMAQLLSCANSSELEKLAYEKWFNKAHVKRQQASLCVRDDKAWTNKKNDPICGLVLAQDKAPAAKGDCVAYVTHFTNMIEDEVHAEEYADYCFVEGVTGNNSTDRLIRQEDWTSTWGYKHLSAGLTRVAIFDERISSFINGEESPTTSVSERYQMILGRLSKESGNCNDDLLAADKIMDELCKAPIDETTLQKEEDALRILLEEQYSIADIYNPERSQTAIDYIVDRLVSTVGESNDPKPVDPSTLKGAQHYRETNIWALNIDDRSYDDKIRIVGYTSPVQTQLGKFSDQYRITHLGYLKHVDGKYLFEWVDKFPGQCKFDFVTIHQGILDKIYSFFKVKGNSDEEVIEKCKITHAFHRALIADHHKGDNLPTGDQAHDVDAHTSLYLPRLIIHSGRSKPGTIDMPQQLPFVQFAALDHAIRDCKYTLSELLYAMHYER